MIQALQAEDKLWTKGNASAYRIDADWMWADCARSS
jgi:hypothetical protein